MRWLGRPAHQPKGSKLASECSAPHHYGRKTAEPLWPAVCSITLENGCSSQPIFLGRPGPNRRKWLLRELSPASESSFAARKTAAAVVGFSSRRRLLVAPANCR